ncbi:MAG: septum formation initiator family protein [Alphaproteobacteria bacterium]|nr:septum formation initiator family protein [Alphaproteobacteria bacterium]
MQRWSGKQIRTLVGSVIGACIVGYFVYHAVQGDRGMIAMLQLQNQVREAQQFLSQVRKDRVELERRVQLMQPDGVDPDMLDEQSRAKLNYAKPNEIIILEAEKEQEK